MTKPLKAKVKLCISCSELDGLVEEVYGKPYNFQQQENCKGV